MAATVPWCLTGSNGHCAARVKGAEAYPGNVPSGHDCALTRARAKEAARRAVAARVYMRLASLGRAQCWARAPAVHAAQGVLGTRAGCARCRTRSRHRSLSGRVLEIKARVLHQLDSR